MDGMIDICPIKGSREIMSNADFGNLKVDEPMTLCGFQVSANLCGALLNLLLHLHQATT